MSTMSFLLPLIVVLATCWADPSPLYDNVPPQPLEEVTDNYRLPRNVVPASYVIDLKVHLNEEGGEKEFYYDGKSEISLKVRQTTKDITFHAKNFEIHISRSYVTYQDDMPIAIGVKTGFPDEKKEFFTITLDREITASMKDVKLNLFYTGNITDDAEGFFKRSYENEDGNERWIAATQFEPTHARQAFPCWDEPDIKTPFEIHITSPKNYKAISNMRVKSVNETTGEWIFYPTPDIPTYLVAFVITDYVRKESKDKTYGVWTKRGEGESGEFALQYGQDVIKMMTKYTGINLNSATRNWKLDQIAIPDFGPGAMENWGLVMYRESGLLHTEETTIADEQGIGTVISHELSHQWFGNLVTCEWWNDIWLNEGFASFFQYYITDQIGESADWNMMDQFVIKNLQSALITDASVQTRPLDPKIVVQTSEQIKSLFDDIAYKKGASVLRMMQQFLGPQVFQNGLKKYLSDNRFKSVTSEKLFTAIESAEPIKVRRALPRNDLSLKDVMNNWVKESGYPVITVHESSKGLNLTQERFFLDPMMHNEIQWYIPITYIEQAPKREKDDWMIPNENKIIPNPTGWIIINNNQEGYYRVNYNENNWRLLSEYLSETKFEEYDINPINRAQLIDDALNLARANRLDYNIALGFAKYLSKETDYLPWYAAVRAFNYLDKVLQGSDQHALFKIYVARNIETFANQVNYTEPKRLDSHVQRLSQVLALDTACKYGLKNCEEFVNKKFQEWLDTNKKPEGGKEKRETAEEKEQKLPIDYRRGIICGGLRKANSDTWNKVVERYKKTMNQYEKRDILAGLGCAESLDIAKEFIAASLDSKSKLSIDVFEAMNSVYEGNDESFTILLDFLNENLEQIRKADEDDKLLMNFVNKLATRVITAQQFAELSLLIHGNLHGYNKYDGMIDAMNNLAWVKFNREEVEKWLQNEIKPEIDDNSASSVTLSLFLTIVSVLLARIY